MTHDEIDALPAGRELDALVAERVMGTKVGMTLADGQLEPVTSEWGDVPHYSTDIAAAWDVVEEMHKLRGVPYEDERYGSWERFESQFYAHKLHELTSSEAAVLICRAALKAVST